MFKPPGVESCSFSTGGRIKTFYQRLYLKKGPKKSIIATSRKMIEILYTMIKTGELSILCLNLY
ncbi:hypothetical protein LEP1GSC125_1712 [Leptospira mayottensis 200901122]|uniref:Uncharacterized protein n=1 Tax=Leptospira mayottensis 200901122 TaxID=1193010 RepID=A0AA87SVX3_9LEPT|nr:hypothetical protein LEP1GSC125_1712 [Leptospira mayottensis 200901122]